MKRIFSQTKSRYNILPYCLIFIVIVVFNFPSIFYFKNLWGDDQSYYFLWENSKIITSSYSRNIVQAIFSRAIIRIATITNIFVARGLVIGLIVIPTSILMYRIFNKILCIPIPVSILLTISPFISAAQILTPTYLVGDYMMVSLLFLCLYILITHKFINNNRNNLLLFIGSIITFFLAIESSELTVFTVPTIIIAVLVFNTFKPKQLFIHIPLIGFAIYKSVAISNNPLGKVNNIHNSLSQNEIAYRLSSFSDYLNPIHIIRYKNIDTFIVILFSIITIYGLFISFKWFIKNNNT